MQRTGVTAAGKGVLSYIGFAPELPDCGAPLRSADTEPQPNYGPLCPRCLRL